MLFFIFYVRPHSDDFDLVWFSNGWVNFIAIFHCMSMVICAHVVSSFTRVLSAFHLYIGMENIEWLYSQVLLCCCDDVIQNQNAMDNLREGEASRITIYNQLFPFIIQIHIHESIIFCQPLCNIRIFVLYSMQIHLMYSSIFYFENLMSKDKGLMNEIKQSS